MMDSPPADPGDLGRQPIIMGLTWALTSLCVVIVAARVYVRARILHGLLSDDWLMLIATAGQVAFQACLTKSLQWGLGKHDEDLSFTQLVNILKWCSPVEGLWNPVIPARRWNPNIELYLAFFSQSTLTFSDLTYVLFPVLVIWKLNMPNSRKMALSALLSLSLLTMTASILKTVTAETSRGSQNAEYSASLGALWSAIEQSFVIIMGSIPPLRPLVTADWPRLRSLGRRFSEIMTMTTTIRPRWKQPGSNGPDPRSEYYNLDAMSSRKIGQSPASQSDNHSSYQGPTIEHVKRSDNGLDEGNHIRRTDCFSLEYSKYPVPEHAVQY
ncbi:hypothetical protein FHL15_007094 [Xylaria flabelliformis]|uniref:Rhodopsin domain-containing protein n=1 Tax=Xylaria flabelliformis TaxID=2512241 RepID=A0A553HVN7_9PEZI|nr:hypothetical protein FHL15_007094 [Xylaria flabelliformis]